MPLDCLRSRPSGLPRIIHIVEWSYPEPQSAAIPKLYKAVREFRHYLDANRAFIPNYGDRYRHREPISMAPAEATVNQVVSKRMVKKQQVRWSDQGAHLLLQLV